MHTIAANTLRRHASTSGPSTTRRFHDSSVRRAIIMPAMSPMMQEGRITQWLKKEGDAFRAGDILLEIESEVATIGVEATNDGIMGKILMPDGSTNVPVKQVIALVARDKAELTKMQKNLTLKAAPHRPAPLNTGLSPFLSGPLTPRTRNPFSPGPLPLTPYPPSARATPRFASQHPLSPSAHRAFLDSPNAQMTPSLELLARSISTTADVDRSCVPPMSTPPGYAFIQPENSGERTMDMDGHSVRKLFLSNFSQTSLGVRTPTSATGYTEPESESPQTPTTCTQAYFDGLL